MKKHYKNNTANQYKHSNKQVVADTGIDTSKYFAFHIAKGDIPEGAEIVIQVRDAETGALKDLNLSKPEQRKAFAESSQFHGKVMADGHMFNPYIHRRFIAAQFKQLVKDYGLMYLRDGVSRHYGWDYAISFLCKEVHKLANLNKHDKYAFKERSLFFTMNSIANILNDYATAVSNQLDICAARPSRTDIYIQKYGCVKRENIRPMKHRFVTLANNVRGCISYEQIDKLLSSFDWMPLPDELVLPYSFVNPFINAGAFYTLKHRIMFEGLRLFKDDRGISLATLNCHAHDAFDYYRQVG